WPTGHTLPLCSSYSIFAAVHASGIGHFALGRDAAKGSAAEVIAFVGPAAGGLLWPLGNLAHNVASRLQLRHEADALSRPQRHGINSPFGIGAGCVRLIANDWPDADLPITSPSPGRSPVGGRPATSQASIVRFRSAR